MKKITLVPKLVFGKHFKKGITQGYLTKKKYRFLDLKRTINPNFPATILNQYIYDPNRSSYISLLMFPNGIITYIIASQYPLTQSKIYNLQPSPILHERGWSNFLKLIPLGTIINTIQKAPGALAQYTRAAGNSAIILRKNKTHTLVRLKSGAQHFFHNNSVASQGVVSNDQHFLRNLKKAGTSRLLGLRPHTRAASMNPVDHPLGGRTRGGMHPQNKNGLLIGTSTARKKKTHNLEHISSRKARHSPRKIR